MDQRSGELEENTERGLEKIDNGVSELEQKTSADSEITEDKANDIADEPEQIREQIEETRSQMSETISAIEEKLSFANISDQVSEHINSAVVNAKDAVYDATFKKVENIMKSVSKGFEDISGNFGEAGTYVVKSARQNPLPLALIGLGLGMLLVYKTGSDSDKKKRYKYDNGNRGKSTFKQFADTGGEYLNTAQKKVGDAAGSAYEGVSTAAASAYEGVTGAAVSAYEGASSFAGSTGEQVQSIARKAQSQYAETLEENPLAIGAIALAVGAVVALSIPISSYENQFMGETKDNLFQTAEDAAREALSKVQESAGEFISNAREEAKGKASG